MSGIRSMRPASPRLASTAAAPISLLPTKAKAKALAEAERLPVFAFDKTDGTSKRLFVVGGWAAVLAHVLKLTRRKHGFFYEMIPEDSPKRLYFDIECDGCAAHADHADRAALESVIVAVVAAVQATAAAHDVDSGAPLVLEGSRPSKCSCHLVFPDLVLVDGVSIRAFVDATCAALSPEALAWVDRGVYDRDRQLRILGSSKRKRERADRVPLRLRGADGPLDEAALRRTLVTCVDAETPQMRVTATETTATKRTRTPSNPMDAEHNLVADRVEVYLRRRHPDLETIYRNRWGDYLEFTLCPGVPCPNNGDRPHRSNQTWFSVNVKKGSACYFCCDPACRAEKTRWGLLENGASVNLRDRGVLRNRFDKRHKRTSASKNQPPNLSTTAS